MHTTMSARHIPEASVWKLVARDACTLAGPALLVVMSGELVVHSDEGADVASLAAGDAAGVAPGRAAELEGRFAGAELIVLAFEERWFERVRELAGIGRVEHDVPLFVERAGTSSAKSVDRLLRALSRPGEGPSARLRAVSLLSEALAVVFQERAAMLAPGGRRVGGRRQVFLEAVEELASSDLEDVSLETFAAGIGLSSRQVSRLFREELDKTFREHLVELRLERAKDLLERTEQSILEVAGETGWSSLAHFNAVFRRYVGATPSGYRAYRAAL